MHEHEYVEFACHSVVWFRAAAARWRNEVSAVVVKA